MEMKIRIKTFGTVDKDIILETLLRRVKLRKNFNNCDIFYRSIKIIKLMSL